MKKYLICLDSGHSMITKGKKTPIFTDGTKSKETGENFMHENEFNRGVIRKLDDILQCCGFDTLYVSDITGKVDTPLKERTDKANQSKANAFVSIHANALTGTWGTPNGVGTYYYPTSKESKKLASIVQSYLVKGTKQKNRGIKGENFHVLRESKMPAILIEAGFMDNKVEAKLLLSEEFRQECAEEIAKGLCEYFKVPYVDKKDKVQKITSNTTTGVIYKVQVGTYSSQDNAELIKEKLTKDGYDAIIIKSNK